MHHLARALAVVVVLGGGGAQQQSSLESRAFDVRVGLLLEQEASGVNVTEHDSSRESIRVGRVAVRQ